MDATLPPHHSSCPARVTPPAPVRQGRLWVTALLDQCIVVGFALFWSGLAWLNHDALGRQADVALLVTGGGGAVLLLLLECWWLVRRGATVGMWVSGVRADPSDPPDLLAALEYFVEFWLLTLAAVLSPVLGTRHADTGLVHESRRRGALSGLARAAVVVLVLVSPVPAVWAFLR